MLDLKALKQTNDLWILTALKQPTERLWLLQLWLGWGGIFGGGGDIERWFKHTDIVALLDWQTEIWLNMTFDWNTSIRNYPGDWLTYSILILYIYIVYVYISTV